MKIEVGEKYVRRDGKIATVTGEEGGRLYVQLEHPDCVAEQIEYSVNAYGCRKPNMVHTSEDLVAPYLDVKNSEGYGKTQDDPMNDVPFTWVADGADMRDHTKPRTGLPKAEWGSTETGGRRSRIGTKIDTSLVPYELVVGAAMGLNLGRHKEHERDHEKGLPYSSLLGSIERHNRAIMDGEEIDDDSGLPHWALLCSSVAMMAHNILQGVIIDDRAEAKQGANIGELAEMAQRIADEAQRHRNPAHAVEVKSPKHPEFKLSDDDITAHEALCDCGHGEPKDRKPEVPFLDFMDSFKDLLEHVRDDILDQQLQRGVARSGELTIEIEEAQMEVKLGQGPDTRSKAVIRRDKLLAERRKVDDYVDLLQRALDDRH